MVEEEWDMRYAGRVVAGVRADRVCLCVVGVHGFLQRDAEFLAYWLKLLQILLVLTFVLDLVLDAWDGG